MIFRRKNEDTEVTPSTPRSKMKRFVGIVTSIILITLGIFILMRIAVPTKPQGEGGLQVLANIKSNVYLNGKYLGKTPLCKGYPIPGCDENETIPSGDYAINIIPDDKSITAYIIKAKIDPGVLTAIEKTFLPGAYASSYVLNLEKIDSSNPEVLITSLPDGALVTLDSSPQGVTPLFIKKITASEHELEVQKPGYGKKIMKIRTVPKFRLTAKVLLGTESPTQNDTQPTSLVTPSSSITPTPEISPTPAGKQVRIKNTSTGFLRVRATPGGQEIAQVLPGESYPYISESENGWYQIKLSTGEEGWISSQFAEIIGE